MTTPEHTPGPWHAEWSTRTRDKSYGWHVFAPEQHDAIICDIHDDDHLVGSREANARLMAASPTLLAACLLTLELSQHADGCKWFDAPMSQPATEGGRARANKVCDCHIKACREAVACTTDTKRGHDDDDT